MVSGLAGIVLGAAGIAAVPVQPPHSLAKLLAYQNQNLTVRQVSAETQSSFRERDAYFENIINNYFKQTGDENTAIANLSAGVNFSIDNHRFRIKISLNEIIKTLELVADGYYFDDTGVNGVDECGLAGSGGLDKSDIMKSPFRLTKLIQSDRLVFEAADRVQIAIMKLLSVYTGKNNTADPEVTRALDAYQKELRGLSFLIRNYT